MMKTLFSTSLLLLLCGPALANTESTYKVEIAVDKSKHTLFVTDHQCSEMQIKTALRDSFFKVCAQPTDDKRVRVGVERRLRDKADESRAFTTLIAASGATFDVLDAKVTLHKQ